MKRIGYIDSMRGLAMTFVVMGHVFIHSGIIADSFISSILLGILAIPVVVASLITGKVLRLSPFISKYMFGQK